MTTKNFKEEEFACPCCKDSSKVNPKLLEHLQLLRNEYGKPIKVHSGYRCEKHNKAVGGVRTSQHLTGNAADISGSDLEQLYELAQTYFLAVGDGRKKGFVHVDLRADKIRRWLY